jgi:hypothetical protein
MFVHESFGEHAIIRSGKNKSVLFMAASIPLCMTLVSIVHVYHGVITHHPEASTVSNGHPRWGCIVINSATQT